MSDQCNHCTLKGNLYDCRQAECQMHDGFYAEELARENGQLRSELRQCCNLLADALPHIECTSQKQSDLITAIGLYLEAADKEGGANHD